MSYLELEVNSIDRDSTSNSSSDYIRTFTPPVQYVKGIRLLRAEIPRAHYNISAALGNNIIDFIYNGTTYSITIPDGAYDEISITGCIAGLMSTATSATITVAFGAATATAGATYKTTFSAAAANLQLLFGTGTNASSSPWYELGFTRANTIAATSITSPNVVQLHPPDSFYISIPEFGNRGCSSNNDYYTFLIPVDGGTGDIVYYEAKNSSINQCMDWTQPICIQRLTVQLKRRGNKIINLNNADWSIVIELFY